MRATTMIPPTALSGPTHPGPASVPAPRPTAAAGPTAAPDQLRPPPPTTINGRGPHSGRNWSSRWTSSRRSSKLPPSFTTVVGAGTGGMEGLWECRTTFRVVSEISILVRRPFQAVSVRAIPEDGRVPSPHSGRGATEQRRRCRSATRRTAWKGRPTWRDSPHDAERRATMAQ